MFIGRKTLVQLSSIRRVPDVFHSDAARRNIVVISTTDSFFFFRIFFFRIAVLIKDENIRALSTKDADETGKPYWFQQFFSLSRGYEQGGPEKAATEASRGSNFVGGGLYISTLLLSEKAQANDFWVW